MEFAGFAANNPPMPGALPGVGRDAEARHLRRIRELEEDIRVLKIESEKQVRLNISFRKTQLNAMANPMCYVCRKQ